MAVTLSVASDPEDQSSRYDFEVRMVGIFEPISGAANMALADFMVVNGGAILYPFAREAVANLTSRGHYGPIWLNPFNIHTVAQAGTELAKGAVAGLSPPKSRSSKRSLRSRKKARD